MQDADNMAYEYAEPQDILASLNKEFWNGLAAKKWTERRDSLLKLKTLASQPKLQPGDYGDVLRELKKIILKDSMVVIVGEAIYCVGALAKSLRNHFSVSLQFYLPTPALTNFLAKLSLSKDHNDRHNRISSFGNYVWPSLQPS